MILVIGNFGNGKVKYNGQTGRTNTIYTGVKRYFGDETEKIDTSIDKTFSFKTLRMILKAKKIIIMPGRRALLPLLTLLWGVGKLKYTSFVVIGGWLPEYIENNRILEYLCKKTSLLFVQMQSMVKALNEINIYNVKWLPNFRLYDESYEINYDKENSTKKKLVFYARVDEEKGIEILIEAFNRIKTAREVSLDIYGPIKEGYKERFFSLIENSNEIKYKGILKNKILSTLGEYDLMIFPTHYDGEGFPGTILESVLAGVPIIASDWKYNSEIISHYKVGWLHDPFSAEDLSNKILKLFEEENNLRELRQNCIETQKYLDGETILKDFIQNIS